MNTPICTVNRALNFIKDDEAVVPKRLDDVCNTLMEFEALHDTLVERTAEVEKVLHTKRQRLSVVEGLLGTISTQLEAQTIKLEEFRQSIARCAVETSRHRVKLDATILENEAVIREKEAAQLDNVRLSASTESLRQQSKARANALAHQRTKLDSALARLVAAEQVVAQTDDMTRAVHLTELESQKLAGEAAARLLEMDSHVEKLRGDIDKSTELAAGLEEKVKFAIQRLADAQFDLSRLRDLERNRSSQIIRLCAKNFALTT